MTAKEYLKQVEKINRLINLKTAELSNLRKDMESLSSPKLSDKICSSRVNNSMSTVDKAIDLEHTIDSEIDKLIDLKAEIHKKIHCICNPDFITLLTYVYINGLTLERTAEVMEKSYSTICRWHGEALQIFRKETGMK